MYKSRNQIAFILLFLMAGLFPSCNKESSFEDFDINDVQIYFRSYITQFIQDAQERNINLDNLSNIVIVFRDDLPLDILAQCNGGGESGIIQIALQHWIDSDYPEKKRIIYHELGHCLLDREHLDDTFSNGHCKSIMENSNCDGQSGSYFFCDLYEGYYLDELFFETQTTTLWSTDTLKACYAPEEYRLSFNLKNTTNSTISDLRLRLKEIDGNPFIFQNSIEPITTELAYNYNIGDLFFEGEQAILEVKYNDNTKERSFTYGGSHLDLGDILLD